MTFPHVPLGFPVSFVLHAWQPPHDETLQQTPSVHAPLAHSPPVPHAWPSAALHTPDASHAWAPLHESGSGALTRGVQVPGLVPLHV
jgi:hypothetical protein